MLINVPQYIDVEDKIVGPLTMKQLGWMIALGIILVILWSIAGPVIFFTMGIPLTIIFVALAFYKPYGQPLGSFVIFGIMYFFRPKVYLWKRTPQQNIVAKPKVQNVAKILPDKHISSQSLRDLAQLMDSDGTESNSEIEKILKELPTKKK
ncbi:MAG: PrgI family protein [bacterium]